MQYDGLFQLLFTYCLV